MKKTDFSFDVEKYIQCFQKKELQLPCLRTSEDYYDDLNELFSSYMKFSDSINSVMNGKIKRVCNHLLEIISNYYKGIPSDAFRKTELMMDIFQDEDIIVYNKGELELYNTDFVDKLKLYRMRRVDEQRIYTRKEIFHSPYSTKESVASCRYSISGYPCLYLGTTLKLCHFETGGANNDLKIASRFQLIRNYEKNKLKEFSVLDLATRPKDVAEKAKLALKNEQISSGYRNIGLDRFLSNYLLWYPIIAACSYMRRIRKDNITFVPEYIIPQMLLQWTRKRIGDGQDSDYLCGIRYFSCNSIAASDRGYNYVFPVCNYSKSEPYCTILSRSFEFTTPVLLSKVDEDYEKLEEYEMKLQQCKTEVLDC